MNHLKLIFLLTLLMNIMGLEAKNYDFKVDNIYYKKLNDTKVAVTYGESKYNTYNPNTVGSHLTINKTVDYYGKKYLVTAIGENAFNSCQISSIDLPESLNTIEEYAFSNCFITSIIIPDNVTSIGNYAFQGCELLKEAILPSGITAINMCTFLACISLQTITIPNNVTEIGGSAFSQCTSLSSVTIPNSVTNIGNYAFYGCPISTIHIPDGVEDIGMGAFKNCKDLCSITGYAGVSSIGAEAFYACESLNSFTIPSALKKISDDTFSRCKKLKEITIPEGVTSIGSGAFWDTSLTEVYIPENVKYIGDGAFGYCRNLERINVAEANCIYDSRDNCNAIMTKARDGYTEKDALICGCNGTIIPTSAKSMRFHAFAGCRIPSVIIPQGFDGGLDFDGCHIGTISVEEGNSIYDSRNNCNAIVRTKEDYMITVSSKTYIPKDIKQIFANFTDYPELSRLYCCAEVPPISGIHFSTEQYQNLTLFVPTGCKTAYESTSPWSNFWNVKEFDPTTTDPTNISPLLFKDSKDISTYDLNGRGITKPQQGLIIIRMKDGSTKKVVAK